LDVPVVAFFFHDQCFGRVYGLAIGTVALFETHSSVVAIGYTDVDFG
jgi:hypothetical protein